MGCGELPHHPDHSSSRDHVALCDLLCLHGDHQRNLAIETWRTPQKGATERGDELSPLEDLKIQDQDPGSSKRNKKKILSQNGNQDQDQGEEGDQQLNRNIKIEPLIPTYQTVYKWPYDIIWIHIIYFIHFYSIQQTCVPQFVQASTQRQFRPKFAAGHRQPGQLMKHGEAAFPDLNNLIKTW